MKTIEKILDLITVVIVAVAAVLLIPWLFGIRPYIVMSGSMEPTIQKWSLTYVDQNISMDDIVEGDVLAYRHGGETVVHRVVDITDEGFNTKGDANEKNDLDTISRASAIGREVFSIPHLGYIIYRLRSTTGFIIAVAIIICYIVITVLSDKEKSLEKNSEEDSEKRSEKKLIKIRREKE